MQHKECSFTLFGVQADTRESARIIRIVRHLNSAPSRFQSITTAPEVITPKARTAHGYRGSDAQADIRVALENSPIDMLQNNKDKVVITDDGLVLNLGEYRSKSNQTIRSQIAHLIDPININSSKENVKVYFDPNYVTPEEVKQIQQTKADALVIDPDLYELYQEKACHIVIRAKVYQHIDGKGRTLAEPLLRIIYYSCFPNLEEYSSLQRQFAPNGILRDDLKGQLIQKFKDCILLQTLVAARNQDFIDIQTPDTLFFGLQSDQQIKAKSWFAKAIAESIKEICRQRDGAYKDLQCLTVHDSAIGVEDRIKALGNFNLPVIVSKNGDSCAVQKAITELGIKYKGAESMIGNATRPIGGGALGGIVQEASEESTTRLCILWVQMVLGAKFNQLLLDTDRYFSIKQPIISHSPKSYDETLREAPASANSNTTHLEREQARADKRSQLSPISKRN